MENPRECVLLIVNPGLLNALGHLSGIMPRKAQAPHSGGEVESSTGYQVAFIFD